MCQDGHISVGESPNVGVKRKEPSSVPQDQLRDCRHFLTVHCNYVRTPEGYIVIVMLGTILPPEICRAH